MYSPFLSLPQTPQVRLSCVLWGLMQTVRGRAPSGVMPAWMVTALQTRAQRIGQVISTLLLAMQAGTLETRRSPAPGGTRKEAAASATATMRLPGQFGWLVKIFGWHVTGFGSQLRHLLADPDMQALLAVSPRAVRTLKPLCRMLMVELTVPPAPVPPTPHKDNAPSGDVSGSVVGPKGVSSPAGFDAARKTAGDARLSRPLPFLSFATKNVPTIGWVFTTYSLRYQNGYGDLLSGPHARVA